MKYASSICERLLILLTLDMNCLLTNKLLSIKVYCIGPIPYKTCFIFSFNIDLNVLYASIEPSIAITLGVLFNIPFLMYSRYLLLFSMKEYVNLETPHLGLSDVVAEIPFNFEISIISSFPVDANTASI